MGTYEERIERARQEREAQEKAALRKHPARELSDPPAKMPSDPPPKLKSPLVAAISHFRVYAEGLSKRVAVLMAVVGGAMTILSIAFSYWTSQQKFFSQDQGKLMLDALARIEASMRAEQETRKGLQDHDKEQDLDLKDHDRAITRLDALNNPKTVTPKQDRIRGKSE